MRSSSGRLSRIALGVLRCTRPGRVLACAAPLALIAHLPFAMAAALVYPPWQHGANNPAVEGVARQIQVSLVTPGGEPLKSMKSMVYDQKVKTGSAVLTQIHHRQRPLFITLGKADAGVTWPSEVAFQAQAGHPITRVTIPPEQNTSAIYAGAVVKGAAHAQAARDALGFIQSPESLQLFTGYGFKPYLEGATMP